MNQLSINIHGENRMQDLGGKLMKASQSHAIFYLNGQIGAGKTTLCRGIIHAAGHQGVVKSPTFTLVEPYIFDNGHKIYHFDLYRMNDPEEFEWIGGRDYFSQKAIIMIEWPEKAQNWLPTPDIIIDIQYKTNYRNVCIRSKNNKGVDIISKLHSNMHAND